MDLSIYRIRRYTPTRGPMELVILHGRRATCRRARANATGQAAPLRRPVGRVGLAKPRVAVAVATMHEALKALAFFHVPVASPPPASVHPSHRVSGRCGALRDQPRRRRLFAMRLRGVWASASGIGSGAACRAPGAPQEPCYMLTRTSPQPSRTLQCDAVRCALFEIGKWHVILSYRASGNWARVRVPVLFSCDKT